jgi:hypothetical protein
MQERNAEIVTVIPLGEYAAVSARSIKLEPTFKQPLTLFYGVKKK